MRRVTDFVAWFTDWCDDHAQGVLLVLMIALALALGIVAEKVKAQNEYLCLVGRFIDESVRHGDSAGRLAAAHATQETQRLQQRLDLLEARIADFQRQLGDVADTADTAQRELVAVTDTANTTQRQLALLRFQQSQDRRAQENRLVRMYLGEGWLWNVSRDPFTARGISDKARVAWAATQPPVLSGAPRPVTRLPD